MKRSVHLIFIIILLLTGIPACGTIQPTLTQSEPLPTIAVILPPAPAGQIVYGSERDGKWQVMLMDADGGNETNLTGYLTGEYSRPVWSPDGQRLAMREEMSMGSGIAVMNIGLENGRPVAAQPAELLDAFADGPTWSPDGTQLAYVATGNGGGWRAYTMVSTGGLPHQLQNIPVNAKDLAWSPDGQRILFSYYADSYHQINDLYLINADGSGFTQVTNTPEISESVPTWSPDGQRIAFSAASYEEGEGYGNSNIYTINADGTGLFQVTTDQGDEFDPAWSPDGTRIAFVSDRFDFNDGNYEIFVINIDGSGELRLTNNTSTDRWLSWRAVPAGITSPACAAGIEFISDISIPNATRFTGPQDFTKIWRVRNSGSCTWTPSAYTLRFIEGEAMGSVGFLLMPGAIQPDATLDLAVAMTAPAAPGLHMGKWGLFDGAGRQVQGPDGNPLVLTIIIEVMSPGTSLLPAALFFRSDRSGSMQIWRMDVDAVTVTQITQEAEKVGSYAVSPADATLAYISGNQLILCDRQGGNRQILANPGEDSRLSEVSWSPVGGTLAYGLGGIHVYNMATGADRLLIANETGGMPSNTAYYSPLSWSPDGTKLLVSIGLYESAQLGILSIADGILLGRTSWSSMYSWKDDNQRFYFASAEFPMMIGENPGLYLAGPNYDLQLVISDAFVWWPFQRRDSRLVYFVSQPAGMDITQYSANLVSSDEYGTGQKLMRQSPFLFDVNDIFQVLWAGEGTSFVAVITRPAAGTSEALLFPVDDNPPVYLMATGEDFQWEK